MPRMTRYNSSGEEIKPGLRQAHQSNLTSIKFDYVTILDSENPDVWHGEALFAGHVLVRTGPFPNELMAGKAAEDGLRNLLARLLLTDRD